MQWKRDYRTLATIKDCHAYEVQLRCCKWKMVDRKQKQIYGLEISIIENLNYNKNLAGKGGNILSERFWPLKMLMDLIWHLMKGRCVSINKVVTYRWKVDREQRESRILSIQICFEMIQMFQVLQKANRKANIGKWSAMLRLAWVTFTMLTALQLI